jgi:enoyl-CoA hydratase/carnithine racemase
MSEANEQVLVEKAGGICTITFNRPEKKNAFTHAMYARSVEALLDAEQDKSVRCVVFTGNGTAFTSGNDLFDFMNNPPTGEDSPVIQFLYKLHEAQKPIVAAVNGIAVGIGVTMLLACDLVYASDQASFKMPFVSLGLVPEGASSFLLPRMAGHAQAAEALLLGEAFKAEVAKEIGLVTRVVPAAELPAVARAQAQKLVDQPPASVRETKALMRLHTKDAVKKAIDTEAVMFAGRLGSPEAAEAFASFFEKRKPDFSKFD